MGCLPSPTQPHLTSNSPHSYILLLFRYQYFTPLLATLRICWKQCTLCVLDCFSSWVLLPSLIKTIKFNKASTYLKLGNTCPLIHLPLHHF